MKPENQDALALDALNWAFSGRRDAPLCRRRQIKAVLTEARAENRETPGKRRSRFWRLGPVWARKAA
jgi:hypothetical protein